MAFYYLKGKTMKKIENCLFCKIINNEIPCFKIYEDNDVISFLDINPEAYGHCLVLPKRHYECFLDIPLYILNKVNHVAKRIAKAEQKALKAKGFNFINNCYEIAGQTIPHFHLHIIPHYKETKDLENIDFKNLMDSIKKYL